MIFRGHHFSTTLAKETPLTLVLPDGSSPEGRRRTVYLLHGLCGRSGDWLDYTPLPLLAERHDVAFVMPDAARSFYADMACGFPYFTYVTEELPDLCARTFRLPTAREDTGVIGVSMGGYGALKCALARPERYAFCAAFASPCLFLRDFLEHPHTPEEEAAFKAQNGPQLWTDLRAAFGDPFVWTPSDGILELAGRAATAPQRPRIYAACGEGDFTREEHLRFAQAMRGLDLDFTFEEWPGKHDWSFFGEALDRALARSR